MESNRNSIVIIGAGPAGLTAAYELSKLGKNSIIIEASDQVGGISKTVNYHGNRFDMGGHRFYSKVPYVNKIWEDILGDDFVSCNRLSRIYYKGIFFDYPLKPIKALVGLGPIETVRIGLSYAKTMFSPSIENETSFEQWVVNRFGYRLYSIFFKTYTEKVWGIPCDEISADWAAQRIKNLSLIEAVKNAILDTKKGNGEVITSLIEKFKYPRLGPGMMWEACQQYLEQQDSTTLLTHKVVSLNHSNNKIQDVVVENNFGKPITMYGDQVISSMPLRELIFSMDPLPPSEVVEAARQLHYRDYLTVVLVINRKEVFPDNWIYIHTPKVKLGRIQNYKNWSSDMVENEDYTTLGLEYFLWESDEEWSWPDQHLIELGIRECVQIGIIESHDVKDSTVVRMKKAYPVYDHAYSQNLKTIEDYIKSFDNLQTIGRNGLHRYNNQDHSMMTGVYAARNLVGAEYDIWSVNVEKEYYEEIGDEEMSGSDRLIPISNKKRTRIPDDKKEEIVEVLYSRLDPVALGGAVGIVSGIVLFLASGALILKGGEVIGPNLSLLGHYLIGYDMTWLGAILGSIEMAGIGFIIGFLIAGLRNMGYHLFVSSTFKRITRKENEDILGKI